MDGEESYVYVEHGVGFALREDRVTGRLSVRLDQTRNIYIRRRRVPLSEIYSSIFENLRLTYTSGTGQLCVEVNASVKNR